MPIVITARPCCALLVVALAVTSCTREVGWMVPLGPGRRASGAEACVNACRARPGPYADCLKTCPGSYRVSACQPTDLPPHAACATRHEDRKHSGFIGVVLVLVVVVGLVVAVGRNLSFDRGPSSE